MLTSAQLRLIVITDVRMAAPRSIVDVVQAAVDAGAPAIQLRAKETTARETAEIGRELRTITAEAGALLFVNDRFDVSLVVEADGVHIGPDDVPVSELRRISPPGFLIGSSTDDAVEAQRLVSDGADYIGCGTVYPTSTKPDAGETIGITGLQTVVEAVEVPVIGIGGVDVNGAQEIAVETTAAGIAVIGAVMQAKDPGIVVRDLLRPFIHRD
ncbi:MAG: thiamine phosphate synthase [Longimicrobiales bacterium]